MKNLPCGAERNADDWYIQHRHYSAMSDSTLLVLTERNRGSTLEPERPEGESGLRCWRGRIVKVTG